MVVVAVVAGRGGAVVGAGLREAFSVGGVGVGLGCCPAGLADQFRGQAQVGVLGFRPAVDLLAGLPVQRVIGVVGRVHPGASGVELLVLGDVVEPVVGVAFEHL